MPVDVTVLCDAVAVFPEPVQDALPGWTSEHQEWTAAHAPANVAPDGGWWLHFHSFLLTSDAGAVLVDTGIGPAGSAASSWLGTTGRLPSLLALAGVAVSDVRTVVLTHVHLDHAGWNTEGELPRFGNAAYVVQQAEVDHVRGTSSYDRYLRPVAEAGQLRVVDGDTFLDSPDGLRLVLTPGHTPGHQVVVTSRAVLGGDVLVHPAQAQWPDLTYVYETDPTAAIHSRHQALALSRQHGIPLLPAHVPPHPATTALCPPHPL